MDAIGVQEGVEVGADLDGQGAGGEPSGSFQQGEFRRGLVGDVGCVGLDAAAPRLGVGMLGDGKLVGGNGSEQRRVDLCPGAAEGDQGAVADPRDGAVLAAAGQEGRRVVVDGGCRAEGGGRD
jgi:hypothetical protein